MINLIFFLGVVKYLKNLSQYKVSIVMMSILKFMSFDPERNYFYFKYFSHTHQSAHKGNKKAKF